MSRTILRAVRCVLVATALFLLTGASEENETPIPNSEWNKTTQLWLARAMVAEAGFTARADHVAIAYVLARRFDRLRVRWPQLRFVDVVRAYCAGLGGQRASLTRRQRWLRGLSIDGHKPEAWPQSISWPRHRELWRKVLRRAALWQQGRIDDPCGGRAWHWGGTIDHPQGRMTAVDCGVTQNTFYTLEPRDDPGLS